MTETEQTERWISDTLGRFVGRVMDDKLRRDMAEALSIAISDVTFPNPARGEVQVRVGDYIGTMDGGSHIQVLTHKIPNLRDELMNEVIASGRHLLTTYPDHGGLARWQAARMRLRSAIYVFDHQGVFG